MDRDVEGMPPRDEALSSHAGRFGHHAAMSAGKPRRAGGVPGERSSRHREGRNWQSETEKKKDDDDRKTEEAVRGRHVEMAIDDRSLG